jgi:putative transposase
VDKRVVLQIVGELRKRYSVTAILKVLEVPRSTYYRWLNGFEEYRNEHEDIIIEICKATNYRNGHRKIRAILKLQHHIHLNRNTVQKIMQKHHLQCKVKPKRKWKSQGESEVIAPNILKRNFSASKPNEKWVTDITYIQYGSETLYLSTIMDLYNNEIVAYKLYNHQQTPLVIDTLVEALNNRKHPEGVIVHSDQGSVYTSYVFQNHLKKNHLISSMSRRGNCWDNAVIESFHSNIKTEEFQYCKFNSISNLDVVSKIDIYIYHYNEERIQEKLGYLTPKEFGNKAA